jgi:LPS-assembly lipoprotein
MSSDNASPAKIRRLTGVSAALAASLLLAGCIQPVYAPTTMAVTGESVRGALASVDVPMIPDRLGHTLRNELVFLLEGRGEQQQPKRYRLLVSATETLTTTIVNSAVQRSDAAMVQATANYRLLALADNRQVAAGTVSSFATYERTPQRFANLRGARDAQLRVSRQLAELMHMELAARLARP